MKIIKFKQLKKISAGQVITVESTANRIAIDGTKTIVKRRVIVRARTGHASISA